MNIIPNRTDFLTKPSSAQKISHTINTCESRGGASGWGTAPEAGRSQVDSRWCHWNFSLISSFQQHHGSAVDSVSNRNEYQEISCGGKGSRWAGLTTLPPPCTDCLKILGVSNFWACNRPVKRLIYFFFLNKNTCFIKFYTFHVLEAFIFRCDEYLIFPRKILCFLVDCE